MISKLDMPLQDVFVIENRLTENNLRLDGIHS